MRIMTSLLLAAALGAASSTYAARYVPPPIGRLMLDAVLPAATPGVTRLPLYLEKTGRYYAELYVEDAASSPASAREPTPLSLGFVFKRGDRVLHEQQVDVVLPAGEHHKTLFWIEAPAQLPARRELALDVSLHVPAPALADKSLRLQITRKFEMRPLAPP